MSRERRGLFLVEEPSAEPGQYGCPMLMRTSRPHPVDRNRPFWRCSLGWAVRTDDDIASCQATESVSDCWKAHPERKPLVAVSALRIEPKAAAD
ncbi:MAG: hypothetical protein R2839_05825 [Thermomicrobiales bacterium]